MAVVVLHVVALAIALASVAGDPKVYAGAECCACLQMRSPAGDDLDDLSVGERSASNCLPGDTAEDETCADEVASQTAASGEGDPVRVIDPACHQTACADDCASAKENGITFAVSDGS
jgi:hypothetical protein